jgi:outer membrane murein-binding lipoprotein Lpp
MTDEPDNLVLTMLRQLDSKVDRMGTDIAELRRQGNVHARTLDILSQDTRMIRAAVNDISKVDVTAGEVEVTHEDINRLRSEVTELAVRVDELEGHPPH